MCSEEEGFHSSAPEGSGQAQERAQQHQRFSFFLSFFIHSFAYLFNRHLFTVYYVTSTDPGADERNE